MLARASLTSSGRWAFFDRGAYNLGAPPCVTAMGRGGLLPEDGEGVWRVEPGEGPAPPRNLPHCPVSPALTLLGTALPGHILTFLQGPLARSVLGGGCGWVPRAGTSWLGWPRRAHGPQMPWTCFGALGWQCPDEGSSLTRATSAVSTAFTTAWWPGRVWSHWGLPNRRPPRTRGSAPSMRNVSVCLLDRAGPQWGWSVPGSAGERASRRRGLLRPCLGLALVFVSFPPRAPSCDHCCLEKPWRGGSLWKRGVLTESCWHVFVLRGKCLDSTLLFH
ncbi:hypothetical protein mRhiFer1_009690 [Rhinolophus ferrumequinum]|uniref:Uncharacterized protein n=1 Tax=Rhinolophus ferrumequinum TaxID=59479 RepID=A0A7J7R0K3_RHIFE|nr:hypothetical protein mRhiFer1_009690 [Rhinolophus ferrumequinum]